MASTYGHVNLISSFGFTARWRHQAVAGLPLESAECVVDLMSGMGELWRSLFLRSCLILRALWVLISRRRWLAGRTGNGAFPGGNPVQDVLLLDSLPASADIVVSSFGLKTFNREQQRRLARIVAVLLKPGGKLSFVEISVPPWLPLRAIFMLYLKWLIPLIGRLLLGNPDCYRMLGVYTQAFHNATHFAECLQQAGLDAVSVSYFFGCATGVRGSKPFRADTMPPGCPHVLN